ncbi:MAG TPA: flagellar biosynthetic protein FliR [Tepidisphaeraceae bacterium]|jgi:flagellar biosynthetic protein FliR|nr:flagellar biosynthetic protein FliR [Tepidisphaeraceae bacterium]
MLQIALNFIPVYVLVLFRIAGMMIWAPLLGSTQIPKRIKAMIACVLAAAITPNLSIHVAIPTSSWALAMAIGGEIVFGAAMGLILSFIFVAAQWAGELIGLQMGLNLGQTLNPQFGGGSSVVGDLYFFLALLIFLSIGGHLAMIRGVFESFAALPLLSVSLDRPLLNTIISVFQGATLLAMQLAAPILVTMLLVDVILGFIGKTVPQLNIMSAGISVRTLAGMMVLIFGLGLTSSIIRTQLGGMVRLVLQTYAPQ